MWADVSFILRSPVRRRILEMLSSRSALTPIMIAKELKLDKANVSRRITELAERKLIECKNPEDRKFRFYSITDRGKKLLKVVKDLEK